MMLLSPVVDQGLEITLVILNFFIKKIEEIRLVFELEIAFLI